MKNLKLTAAVLALIAAAVFTSTAKAQVSLSNGDIIFGVYDSAASGAAPNSFEVDLGAFSSLTAGESFLIGSNLANTFLSDATPSLVFDIAGTGGTAGGGLAAKQIAFTAPQVGLQVSSTNTAPANNNLALQYGYVAGSLATGSSSTGVTFTEFSDANTDANSFSTAVNNSGGNFGIGAQTALGTAVNILTPYTLGGTAITDFYTETNHAQPVFGGVWSLSGSGGSTTLTFLGTNALTPEPSTYALMFGGLIGLAVFLRRRLHA